jgi:pimeloyl-ACP methyl ester carboxylesterase
MPTVRVTRLSEVGHWPMIEDPDGVVTALTASLRNS